MIIKKQLILNSLIEKGDTSTTNLSIDLEIPLRSVQRVISELKELKYIISIGAGANIVYRITTKGKMQLILEDRLLQDQRLENMYISTFNEEIFDSFKTFDIFDNEKIKLVLLKTKYKRKLLKSNNLLKKRELERLIIEFSWKSSLIEGNTYSLLETEELLYNNNYISNKHSKEETQMILNHKSAFEFIVENPDYFQTISKKKILELHKLLTKDMGINQGFRSSGVGITGSLYRPLDNKHQIEEMIEKTCDLINKKSPYEKAFLAGLLISYIQPFDDGNKRTSRILSNAILNSFDLPMLSFRSLKVDDYKTAVLAFYEFNSLFLYKKIFINQLNFFVENYF
jgi:Fic/DOC family